MDQPTQPTRAPRTLESVGHTYLREDVAEAQMLVREIEVLEAVNTTVNTRLRMAREQLRRLDTRSRSLGSSS